MLSDASSERSAPEVEWPVPSAEVRRGLEPVPRWTPAPPDEREPDAD